MCRRIITRYRDCDCVAADEPQLCGNACPLDDSTEYKHVNGYCWNHIPAEDQWKDVPLEMVSDIYREVMEKRRPERTRHVTAPASGEFGSRTVQTRRLADERSEHVRAAALARG